MELISQAELNPKVPLFLQFRAVVRTQSELSGLILSTSNEDDVIDHQFLKNVTLLILYAKRYL